MSIIIETKNVNHKTQQGYVTTLILVFSGIFLLILGSLVGFVLTQYRLNQRKIAKQLAFQIAEAGLEYYRWHLSHYPEDLQDGTGQSGPYEHEYTDPQGETIGTFSLEINGQTQCESLTAIDITSTGWSNEYPNLKIALKARYARPSIAEFAYIINDNVWAGSDRVIKGKYHSNGGIRMDGTTDSLVTSAVEEWNCTSSFGCSPCPTDCHLEGSLCKCPGVFGQGDGQEQGLWQYPVESIDFLGITLDLSQMKTLAQSYGFYLPPPSDIGYPNGQGYHLILKDNGTFDLYVITGLTAVYGYSLEEGWHWDYHVISQETKIYSDQTIPSGCGLIFLEDNLWIEGNVKGKTTIVSADLIHPNIDTNIILNGNINYTTFDGSDGLAVVAEHNILIPLYSPDQMTLDGIFLAQKGHFGRNHYPWWYWPWYSREHLEIYGSIISNGRVGTKWSSNGHFASGYQQRENSYDRKLATNPPPLLPNSDDEYEFVKWEQIE